MKLSSMMIGQQGTIDRRKFTVVERAPEGRASGVTVVRFSNGQRKTFVWDVENPELSPPGIHDTDPLFREADEQMHKLWTWAVGLPGYDKRAWQQLESRILKLARRR